MYAPWRYLPPPNPYLAILRAQKTIEVVDRENVILSRQVCELARQNVDLRTKIIKMSTENYLSDRKEPAHVGYSKEVIKVKEEREDKRHRIEDDRQARTEVKKEELGRAYSFGQLNKNQTQVKEKRTYHSGEKQRITVSQHYTAPKKNPEQKRFTYLTAEESKGLQKGQQRSTIIEGLNELNRSNNENPENPNRPILRIQSEAYNEPMQPRKDPSSEPQIKGKKSNRVYLQSDRQDRPTTYSPISKLKSIKKLTEAQPQIEPSVLESKKTMGKRQYLSLIGSVFQKSRNDGLMKQTNSIVEEKQEQKAKQNRS